MMKFFRIRLIIGLLSLCCVNHMLAKNSGLLNFNGKSCYFNASLQAMSHLKAFYTLLFDNYASYQLFNPTTTTPQRLLTSFYVDTIGVIQSGNVIDRTEFWSFYKSTCSRIFTANRGIEKQEDAAEFIENFIRDYPILEHMDVRNFLSTISSIFIETFSQFKKTIVLTNPGAANPAVCLFLLKTLVDELSWWFRDGVTLGDTIAIGSISKRCDHGTKVYKAFELRHMLPLLDSFLRKIREIDHLGVGGTRGKLLSNIVPMNEFRRKICDLFYCRTRMTKTCADRGHKSIDEKEEFGIKIALPEISPGQQINLIDCIRQIFLPEQMSRDNWVSCEKCGNVKGRTFSQTTVLRWPQFLFIQLKRFVALKDESGELVRDGITGQVVTTKVSAPVSFPLAMGLGNNYYELRSFIVHAGDVGGGHYWAFGKDEEGKWYRYNDSSVSDIGDIEKEVTEVGIDENGGWGGTPYILFYEKKETPVTTLDPKDRLDFTKIPAVLPKLEQLRVSLRDLKDSLKKVRDSLAELKK